MKITKENYIHIIPDRVKFQQAASLPVAACTSLQALNYFYKNNNKENNYSEYGIQSDLEFLLEEISLVDILENG